MTKAAVADGYIGRDPCVGVKLPRLPHREMLFLDATQVEELVGAAPEGAQELLYVLAYGGLRFGEAAALRRSRCLLLRSLSRRPSP